jgi:hypothetical protein
MLTGVGVLLLIEAAFAVAVLIGLAFLIGIIVIVIVGGWRGRG